MQLLNEREVIFCNVSNVLSLEYVSKGIIQLYNDKPSNENSGFVNVFNI